MNLQEQPLREEFLYLLDRAIIEEFADKGDITGEAIFPCRVDERDRLGQNMIHSVGTGLIQNETIDHQDACAQIYSRECGVVSGLECAILTFRFMNPRAEPDITCLSKDGDKINDGQPLMEICGSVTSLLRAERVALNFLGFFSGIASATNLCCAALQGSKTRLLDTRKTLPAYRHLSKAAVVDGGGMNHRMGLYDMVMIKDNHIQAAGSIERAIQIIRQAWGDQYPIEVECRNLDEVTQALRLAVKHIMLDNMSYGDCKRAIQLRKDLGRDENVVFEASGDFTPEKIRYFADLNLDYISVGAITHSVKNHNLSMRLNRVRNG